MVRDASRSDIVAVPVFTQSCRPPSAEDREMIRATAVLGVLFAVAVCGAYVATASWGHVIPRDGTTLVVGRDFLNFWMYGRAAWIAEPAVYYDAAVYNAALGALLGEGYPGQSWSYPPSIMLMAWPFGLLGYLQALLIWSVLSLAVFAAAARQMLSRPASLVALLVSPAVVMCLISGQHSLLIAAAIVVIFLCLDSRPLLAGVLIGLLTLKPQVGLLFPVLLIASGRWRTFIAASVTALAAAAVTAAVFGPQVWVDFVLKGLPVQNFVMSDPGRIATPFYPTVFMNLRGLNLGYSTAMAVQSVFSIAAAGTVFWAFRFRRDADPAVLMALFVACSVAAVPYLLSYDTLPLTLAALVLLGTGRLDGVGRRLAQLVYWLPLLQIALGTWHIPGPSLIAPAFAAWLAVHLYRSRAEAQSGPEPELGIARQPA